MQSRVVHTWRAHIANGCNLLRYEGKEMVAYFIS